MDWLGFVRIGLPLLAAWLVLVLFDIIRSKSSQRLLKEIDMIRQTRLWVALIVVLPALMYSVWPILIVALGLMLVDLSGSIVRRQRRALEHQAFLAPLASDENAWWSEEQLMKEAKISPAAFDAARRRLEKRGWIERLPPKGRKVFYRIKSPGVMALRWADWI